MSIGFIQNRQETLRLLHDGLVLQDQSLSLGLGVTDVLEGEADSKKTLRHDTPRQMSVIHHIPRQTPTALLMSPMKRNADGTCRLHLTLIRLVAGIVLLLSSSDESFTQNVDPTREFLDGKHTSFNSQEHPKAKGAHFKISYPNSWAAMEGERPNIVQKFVSEGGLGLEIATITTMALPLQPGTSFTEADAQECLAPGELKNMVPKGAVLISARPTKIEDLPAGILEYSWRQERAGVTVDTQVITYIFYINTTMVQFQGQVAGKAPSVDEVSRRMETFKPLFVLMANSIVIPDRWRSNRKTGDSSSSLDDDLPSLLLALFLSVGLAWGIGLTPPLLIRYAFVRHPLSKTAATWIAAGFSVFFWMALLIVKVMLGEKLGTGAVWIIIFFVSRWIMSRTGVQAPPRLRR